MLVLLLLGFSSQARAAPFYSAQQPFGYDARHNNLEYYTPLHAQQQHIQHLTGNDINVPYYQPEPVVQHMEHQLAPIITKRFYVHSAPEEPTEEISEQLITLGQPRKSYNIIFIKAPAAKQQRTVLKIKPSANEERTIIYVLSKKAAAAQIDAQIIEPSTTTSKPEVFFIKYKTSEEAKAAQQQIQAQYDQIDGPTEITHEPAAPVTSVIGSLQPRNPHEAYLPATRK